MQAKLKQYRHKAHLLEEALIEAEDQQQQLLAAIEPIPPTTPSYTPRRKPKDTPIVAVGSWSDWHGGQVIKPEEVQGYGVYNMTLMKKRVGHWCSTFLDWVEVQRHAYRIEDCNIVALGDMVHGLIHLENLIYNEVEPLPAAVEVGELMAVAVSLLAPHFRTVTVDAMSCDNHGRLTKRVLSEGRGKWSLGYVCNAVASARLANHRNVHYNAHNEMKMEVMIANKLFLCEHGNDMRSWMGIPYYAMERLVQREYRRRANTGRPPFHMLLCGHFHTPVVLPNVMMNGSLCGTTAYDHAVARHAEPCQQAFLVHPVHGMFNYLPITLTEAK